MKGKAKAGIPAEKTAIVLIEPQNDFLSPAARCTPTSRNSCERGVIGNLANLLSKVRGKVKIFYVRFIVREGFPELKKGGPGCEGLRGIEMDMKADWGTGAWLKGTPVPRSSRNSRRGRATSSWREDDARRVPFDGARLPAPGQPDEYVAFTGFHTNWCVESSARSAYDKGTGARDLGLHGDRHRRGAELRGEVDLPEDRKVMTSREFLASLV